MIARAASLALSALLVVSTAAVVRAEESAGPLTSAAAAVERVVAKGSSEDVAALAATRNPDPFLVAEMLCGRSHGAARAFGRGARTPDTRGLDAYVRKRLESPPGAADLTALESANAELSSRDWSALTTRKPRAEETVTAIALALWQAEAMHATGEIDEAASGFLEAGRRAKRVGWLRAARHAFFRGALASHAVLRYDDMLVAFSEVAAIERARERPGPAAEALFLRGSVHSELGQHPAALAYMAEARKAFAALDDKQQIARVLNGEALAYLGMGEHGRGLVLVERGLSLTKSPRRRLELLSTLGRLSGAIGEYNESAEAFRGALAIARAAQQRHQIALQLGNVGVALTNAGDFDAAEKAYREALATCESLGHVPSIATALENLGYLALLRGEPEKALPLCRRALKLATETKSEWLMGGAEQNLAQTYQHLAQYGEAVAAFQRSVGHAEAVGARRLLLEGHFGIAECRLAQGKPKEALAAAEVAIAQLGSMVGGLAEGQDARARAQHAAVFEVAAEAAAQLDDAAALARVIERGRAMALLESLEGRAEIRRLSIPEAFRKDEAAARAALSRTRTAYQGAIARRLRRKELRKHHATWKAAEAHLETVVGRIRRAAKDQVALVYPQADDLPTLRTYLHAGDAFVLYALTPKRYIALIVEKETERIVTLGARTDIDARCEALVDAATDWEVSTKTPLAALQKLAIDRLGLTKSSKRLLVSPAGRLFLVPLAAMVGGRTVTYIPSATTYGVLRESAALRGTSVLALGDVDYSGHARLRRLSASGKEAEAVGDKLILGTDASEAVLRKTLATKARWRAVHLACHGLVDTDRPMRSALALVKTPVDDGLLSVLDIFAMKVPADLVVLSACESGRGRIYAGEGIVGLTRAFMYADAPRVICSLWKVDDEATAALMEKFYKLWNPKQGKGVSVADALEQAQAHIRAQKKWQHPYYWAAWVLWGLPE